MLNCMIDFMIEEVLEAVIEETGVYECLKMSGYKSKARKFKKTIELHRNED